MNVKDYMEFIDNNKHEYKVFDYIKLLAIKNGFVPYHNVNYQPGDKIIFEFRNKLIALVEVGADLSQGANVVVSHMDSPRLDVIPGDPFVSKDDGDFMKVTDYGGIILQSWLDEPLHLIGKISNKDKIVMLDTDENNTTFVINSLLPHLNGRKEMNELKYEKLLVRTGFDTLKHFEELYGLTKENFLLADLSFVPAVQSVELGFDKQLISGYGHDDRSCVYAELQAILNSDKSDKTKIALFVSYEETGSAQSTGSQTDFIDDIFLELTKDYYLMRKCMQNSKVLSADVAAGYDSNFNNHFEENCKAICGKGVALVPFTGRKGGNDSTIEMRHFIEQLCINNNIDYQIETTKVSEGGGGTVAKFFAMKGMDVIDAGVPVLAMHSPQEIIHKHDLEASYELYKVFFESK